MHTLVFSDGTKQDYYRQTSASTMVSIARENTCDNSNIDLRTLSSRYGPTGHGFLPTELEDPRFQSGHMDISPAGLILDLQASTGLHPIDLFPSHAAIGLP